jgi:nitrite reductase/ring-hydroxylating ferredoxin subunit
VNAGRIRVGELAAIARVGVAVVRGAKWPTLVVVPTTTQWPYALSMHCPHQGAELLAGYVGGGPAGPWIECPLHAWRFDLETGRRLIRDEPSPEPMDRIATAICDVDDEGIVWVTLEG